MKKAGFDLRADIDEEEDLLSEEVVGFGESMGRCEDHDPQEGVMETYETVGMLQLRYGPDDRSLKDARKLCVDVTKLLLGVDDVVAC